MAVQFRLRHYGKEPMSFYSPAHVVMPGPAPGFNVHGTERYPQAPNGMALWDAG